MKVTCKCHGVSGSCSLITCWQQLAPFRKVGDHLEKRYDDATRVKTTRQGRLRVRRKVNNVPTANDLVFLHRSPNYCHANDTIGSLGKFLWYHTMCTVNIFGFKSGHNWKIFLHFLLTFFFTVFDDFSNWRVPNVQNLEKSSNIAKN